MKENSIKPHFGLKKIDILLIFFLILIGLVFRLYKIGNPVADWHSWRQADTAAVARNFVRGGFDLLHPKYDDLGRNQTGLDNPQGYRFVEFPFYNSLFATLYKIYSGVSLEIYGRLTSIIFSLLIIAVIYILLLYEDHQLSAFFGALVFAIMPFFIYYSRVILPEMTALSLMFVSILLLYFWPGNFHKKKGWLFFSLSLIFGALALLVKPTTIFFLIPLIYIFIQKNGIYTLKKVSLYIFLILVLLPTGLWRLWIQNFPQGVPASNWLISVVNTYEGPKNIFFRPAFFRWIFYERIPNLILGSYLIFPLLLGFLKKPKKSWLIHSIALSSLVYLFTFQGGNVQHDYYQTLILPSLAMLIGIGFGNIFHEKRLFSNQIFNISTVIVILGFSFAFSYYKVKDYYSTDPNLIKIAKIVNTVTASNVKIVTDRDGDTTLLYLADRKGVAAVYEDLSIFKNNGFKYFVTLHKEIADEVKKQYKTIFENDQVFIFKL
ncbi:hypothetical protein A3C23_02880 [Candidatus Roizmanbacteria bacterium RIFCSPHIGHO2_02_FULL_37_13b]|uniref:Glycosyltransferase RgtA/B/C/D-like domain-containing protein n=1 Tax=Candidatus Roizmanbacteria bacterium RIFCSPLOWO2_02_FULL_36_11 TaxID=1802071 RepID=A0A1F7JG76_9BACT|nr:MAG: hypothetical protein A3C23_02880 [Candidatus Roizmanbacteria bacterium RIFCSPHIGHO2_02_FULL_37_13b]OGK54618.1 MAG: hypothetical protein A3H78_01900 [Candidatus Roizmanbacteria bacterium RIFCSPLOWO2_02_FULL_36_11]